MGDQKRTVLSLLYETLTRERFRKMEKFILILESKKQKNLKDVFFLGDREPFIDTGRTHILF